MPCSFGAFLLRTGKGGHLRAECIYAAISLDAGKGDRQSIRPQLRGGGPRSCHNDPERSIVAIENGHVTGRKGGGRALPCGSGSPRGNPEQLHDHLSYLTRTKDGKILKSTTIYIRDDDGAPIGIFGINYDITLMLAMENAIKQFTATEKDEKEPEPIARNVSDLLDELIEQSVKVVGKAGGPDEQGG